ncbi:MAG: hypothetical protein AAB284_06660, partial [Chloroflexota bacterium]
MTIQLGLGLSDPGAAAIWTRDDGSVCDPRTDAEWDDWVTAGSVRHWCDADPLLDWLDRYGERNGFVRDDRQPSYDPRFDLLRLLGDRSQRFEELVVAELARRVPVTRIAGAPDDIRSLDAARATWQALANGDPIVARGVLRDPQSRMYGVADLLVRSDLLREVFPGAFDGEDEPAAAPAIPGARWHYRIIDVRYTTLELLREGSLSTASDLVPMAQLWTLANALGRLQGYTPAASYVLGRGWRQGQLRGTSCWDRLGRVPQETWVRQQERDLSAVVADAAAWVRQVRTEGIDWQVLPLPTVPELWPNMKDRYDSPWQRAKRAIADQLFELTLLAQVGPRIRAAAHSRGVTRWDDRRVSAAFLGLHGDGAAVVDALLEANRSHGSQIVFPARITADEERWRAPAPVECYVDFETVNDALDDLSTFPERGGQTLIFQIGCGRYDVPAQPGGAGRSGGAERGLTTDIHGSWTFRQFTAPSLTPEGEAEMIDAWIAHLRELAAAAGLGSVSEIRLFHWSAAETSAISAAYESAWRRHHERHWPELSWYDLLAKLVRAQPVVVRGANGFGLKAVANALFAHGIIGTQWADGLADGAGVMAGTWHAAKEARLRGLSLSEVDLMREVDRYNEIDCRVMAEV